MSKLSDEAAGQLQDQGFVVIPGPGHPDQVEELANAFDDAVAAASGDAVRVGSTTTRVGDFVNRGAAFDDVYVFPSLLDACARVIAGPSKLSSFHARTVQARSPSQELHVDVQRESMAWPLVGFILMIDGFRPDNGATRFVPGSHRWLHTPADSMPDLRTAHDDEVLACGPAGSLLIFHGSTWHGHAANTSSVARSSLQGAFILRDAQAAIDWGAQVLPETLIRLSLQARRVLAL